jgi:hypothetical protein
VRLLAEQVLVVRRRVVLARHLVVLHQSDRLEAALARAPVVLRRAVLGPRLQAAAPIRVRLLAERLLVVRRRVVLALHLVVLYQSDRLEAALV